MRDMLKVTHMRRAVLLPLTLCAGLALAAAARAAPADFMGCDGYGEPTSGGDGMTHYAMSLGIFNFPGQGNTLRGGSDATEHGVADCDAALANLPAKYWLRKVSLLNARATHHLEYSDTADALVDLDNAAAAAVDPAEPYYLRSLAWDTKFLRAYALRKAGQDAQAQAIVLSALEARPYEPKGAIFALAAIGIPKDAPLAERLLKQDARFNPHDLDLLFSYYFDAGRFDDALNLCGLLTPERPRTQAPDNARARVEYDEAARIPAVIFTAVRAGQCAYALAAKGKAAEARAALDAARAQLRTETSDPPPGADDDQYARMLHINTSAKILAAASPALDTWEGTIKARLLVADGHPDDALVALKAIHPFRTHATLELLEAIAQKSAQASTLTPIIAELRAFLAKQDVLIPESDVRGLWNNLPEVEAPERIPAYDPAMTALFGDPKDFKDQHTGYREFPGDTPNVTVVRYRGAGATMAIVSEMALLRAADLARRAGKSGFVILSRNDVKFTLTMTRYGTPLRTDPNGFETELDVTFVDPHQLPAAYATAPFRVIDADAAYAALAPIYRATAGKP